MKILIGIFILALFLRFLYFPNNIYFGFDQARDAFTSQAILKGDLKIVGPPTAVEGLFHGPLYYYFYAPLYFFSDGNPEVIAAFLRIVNAVGVFLIFLIGLVLFNKRVGLISAFLYAISFEQTQYALYFNHPSLAVISVSLFYLGLALLFFKHQKKGLILALFGLGLSIQFEFVLVYLILVFIILILVFRKLIPPSNWKILVMAVGLFLLTTITFILSEIRFQFSATKSFLTLLTSFSQTGNHNQFLNTFSILGPRFVNDNIFGLGVLTVIFALILFGLLLWRLNMKTNRSQLVFILIWFFGGFIPYLNNTSLSPLYYYGVGVGISLLVFIAYLINLVLAKHKFIGLMLLVIPIASNLALITTYNSRGSIPTINVQSGMLLSDEKAVVDYICQKNRDEPFAVNALSMPLYVNTTWSYLFRWYGKARYNCLPIWGGDTASGYPGSLENVSARSKLPEKTYLIIEPTRGIRPNLVDSFIREEGYFSAVSESKNIGDFIVQTRRRK